MIKNMLNDFIKEEKGQTVVEWIVILAVILVIILIVLYKIGTNGQKKANVINDALK